MPDCFRLPQVQKDLKREQKTVLTLDTRTVEPSQTTTYFCGLWIGTAKTAKTTTNFCPAFTTTFGSCFDAFFLCKIDPKPRTGALKTPCQAGSAQADPLLARHRPCPKYNIAKTQRNRSIQPDLKLCALVSHCLKHSISPNFNFLAGVNFLVFCAAAEK